MEFLADASLGTLALTVLFAALAMAYAFEFVNGFHDTANAVVTVIYTHSLTPTQAVVWSGIWNFLGVALSSGAVAYAIVSLLPIELVLHVGTEAGMAMVLALLLSAIVWNVGTWYIGLPASSSHTLIGSIVGVGLANSLLAGEGFGEGVNWGKVNETVVALVASPLIGFVCAALLLMLLRLAISNPALYQAPEGKTPPPWSIRAVLLLTCTGVSFAHGSNDGQKGMGLVMLILIALAPSIYALNLPTSAQQLQIIVADSRAAQPLLAAKAGTVPPLTDDKLADTVLSRFLTSGKLDERTWPALALKNADIAVVIGSIAQVSELGLVERSRLRRDLYLVDGAIVKLVKHGYVEGAEAATLERLRARYRPLTHYIPDWVKFSVAVALGLGTMIGWKRVVRTVGEKIGHSHLTYAQGASAETVAMLTIGTADMIGAPVSTTHILSSGVAGAMYASRARLQRATLRNILLAWVFTLPACVLLGSVMFAGLLYAFIHPLG
jgi:PiT family inorganic phosphate transporter